jgi:glycosyltransferase involved in cell wall biosynthesis
VLEAFEALRQANPRVKLVVVGDGPERLRAQAQYRDAIFVGAKYGSDLAAHYASADIFLFPSMSETYGNVTVEALASGLAVIAYRYAAAAEHIVNGENGITVPFGDREAFIGAAIGLVSQREHRARMREAARASMVRIDWDHIVSEFESALFDVARAEKGMQGAHAYA